MSTFSDSVTAKATTYLGEEPQQLSVDLAIEQFKDLRNYPSSFSDEVIETDLSKNINKIAMAVAEIDAKIGIEGQVGHNENGINRSYGDMALPKAYATVISYAKVF